MKLNNEVNNMSFNENEIRNLAKQKLSEKNFSEAESLFAKVILQNPNCLDSLTSLGIINLEKKRGNLWKDKNWLSYVEKSAKLGALISQSNKLMKPVDFFKIKI